MELLDAIYTRRSVREYTEEPVSREQVESLLNAGVYAPCGGNSQPWLFAVIQDGALLRTISRDAKAYMLSQLDANPRMRIYAERLSNPDFDIFYNAGTLVMVYTRPEAPPQAVTDCALAAQNIMLLARGMGLGTCWIGFAQSYMNLPEVKEKLGVPADSAAAAAVIVGHPAGGDGARAEKRPPEVLFWKQ